MSMLLGSDRKDEPVYPDERDVATTIERLNVERLLEAADIALRLQEVARQSGNMELLAALEPLRHAVREARRA